MFPRGAVLNDQVASAGQPATCSETVRLALLMLATATIGIVLMKESKRIGRKLFPTRTLAPDH